MKKKLLDHLNISPVLKDHCYNLTTDNFDEYLFFDGIGYNSTQGQSYHYPHKPFLVPLLLNWDWPGTLCYAIHFFLKRQPSFVLRYHDNSFETREIAFNFKQLVAYYTILSRELNLFKAAGGVHNRVKELGFGFYEDIDKFIGEYGVFTEEAYHLDFFRENLPIESCKYPKDYTGSAFANDTFYVKNNIYEVCTYEVNKVTFFNEIREQLKADFPKWLTPKINQQELFDSYYAKNELDKAWLSLNSYGWGLKDTAWALDQLKKKTNDKTFHLVADNWVDEWKKSDYAQNDSIII